MQIKSNRNKAFNSIKIELLHVFTTRGVKLNSRRKKNQSNQKNHMHLRTYKEERKQLETSPKKTQRS